MASFLATIGDFLQSLPAWVRALLVLTAGGGASFLVRLICWKLLPLVRFDVLCARIGVSEFLRKGQVNRQPSRLVGSFVGGLGLLVTVFQVSRQLDIEVVTSYSREITAGVPHFLAAVLIVVVGLVVVSFVGNFVMTIARNAAYPHAGLVSRAVKVVGTVLVLSLALEQLNLSRSLVTALFEIAFAAVALGLALAFGLGCKDLARESMLRFLRNLREKERAGKGPDLEG
jgi:hypothetical protein